MRRCSSCGEENSDRARFCQRCAAPLDDSGRGPEVRKAVTIVFVDVSGSTALGERLDPEAMRHVMGTYFDRMSIEIERHGGTVEKFIGDAVMAVFGIPRSHEDDPLRAVRAAVGMRETLEGLSAELRRDHGTGLLARIGVNSGEVVAGDPTAGQRLVTGDAVNVAARLEQAAEPGAILLGEPTYRLVRDAVHAEALDPLELKGKAEPVPAYRLVSVREDAAGHERRLDSPMVGRARELELMARALERATTERTSHLFTLLGPAGVGKSRLVQEFLAGPAADATVLRGRCLSYGEGITFFPLVEAVQEAAGVSERDDLAAARSKLASLVSAVDEHDRVASLVAGLLAWAEPGATEEAFWGVRRMLEHLARDRPLVLVIDDIHWAEPTFLDLIEHLADWTRDAAVFLVCVARPELLETRSGWAGGKLNATSILLGPLDADATSHLVDNLLGRSDIPAEARERILESAEGNPLFVEETLGMLIDDGLLRLQDGSWRATAEIARVEMPPTIQLLLAARLDRLDSEERAVIERGAVEGKVFHAGAVTTLAPEALRPRVPSRLLQLTRKELIRPDRAEFAGQDAFRFRHLLIRDAAYHAMSKEQRAELHERFAGWLEDVAGIRSPEYAEILGFHLEHAHRYRTELGMSGTRSEELARRAADHLLSSGTRAHRRGDLNAARGLLERAAALAEGAGRIAVIEQLADVLDGLANFADAARLAAETVELATEAGDRRLALRARLTLINAAGQTDPSLTIAGAEAEARSILREFERIGDEEGRVIALMRLARLAFFSGHVAKAREIAEELAPRAAGLSIGDRLPIAFGFTQSAYFGDVPLDESFRLVQRAREIVGDSLLTRAITGTTEAGLLGMAGRFDEARHAIELARAAWDELGLEQRRLAAGQTLGELERLAGRPDVAEQIFRTSHEALDAIGETGFNSTVTAMLALTLCDLGRFDEAERAVVRSREMAAEDDFATHSTWRLAQAGVLSHRGEHAAAVSLTDAAVALVDATDYVVFQGGAYEARGRVLAAAGRTEEARASLRDALARYERKGVVPAIARVKERLAGLDG